MKKTTKKVDKTVRPITLAFSLEYLAQLMSFLSVWHYSLKRADKATKTSWTLEASRPGSPAAMVNITKGSEGCFTAGNPAGKALLQSFSDWLKADRILYKVDRFTRLVIFEKPKKTKKSKTKRHK